MTFPVATREAVEDDMDVNARLEKLERENRQMKKIGIVGAVVVSSLFISGQAKTNKVVEANEFHLVDASGKVLASLGRFGQTALVINSPNGEADVLLGSDSNGPFLIMGSSKKKQASLDPKMLLIEGSSGKFSVDMEGTAPSLTVEDNEGYASVLGGSALVTRSTGRKEETPAASLVLFGKDKKVLWSAP